ncbi:hypothetical protein Pdw03_3332 [Penicillium digitatum]|uniref:Uncharacterized protein n=2 Tax=Penicillium digitatum TaxID=36651 RepID=A0A7T6XG17_PENDI|nr:hypothetical protein Pdw03_3332 [Penicillium digitatum]
MSQYPPVRPWATLSAIDRDHESGILYEDERQQWFRQHPNTVPRTEKRSRNRSQHVFTDRGPSMAKDLRGIAERGAARRNGTAPLPPIPQQEDPQPATTVTQDDFFQRSDRDINKMSIYYVLDRSNMQGHHDKTSFAQQEVSQPATKVDQKALLKECKLPGYDDETSSTQPREFEPTLSPLSHHCYNAQASDTSDSSYSHHLDHAAPTFEAPHAQANPSSHHNGCSTTSWYEALPNGHKSSPDTQVAVASNATLDPEIKQENQFTEVGVTIDELLALINQEKENDRLANENHNPGGSYSTYRLAPLNSASMDIYHADQCSGPGSQPPGSLIRNAESPLFVSPGPIHEDTPATPVWSPPQISSYCPEGCCYWSSDESETEIAASPEPQFERERSDSNLPLHESPLLPSSPPQAASLQEDFTWRSDNASEIDADFVVPFEHVFAWDYTTPGSPLLDSPLPPAPADPSPERRPSNLREYSHADVPRVGIHPSQIPHDLRLTPLTFRPDYISSPVSYPRRPRDDRANIGNVEQSLVPQQLNVNKSKTTFTMDVPVREVSLHQTAIHVPESTNGGHSRTASFVNNDVDNTPTTATPSRITQSPDVSSSEGSEDSRGIKRKRFTKNLFGKKGYLEDNEGPRDKRFRFLKEALEKGHSTIGNIKGMFWDENRALIGSSKPSIVTENTASITLNTGVQSILYAEIENMITHAANEFLMKEYYEGHLSTSSLLKVKRRWEKRHMPGVPEFRFDQTTQYRLISANRNHLSFGETTNGLGPNTVLGNWKKICKNMSIRTFVAPDSVVKKHIHDILDLLEILNADRCHLELIMALNAHIRGELKKHEVMQHYRDTQTSGNSRS